MHKHKTTGLDLSAAARYFYYLGGDTARCSGHGSPLVANTTNPTDAMTNQITCNEIFFPKCVEKQALLVDLDLGTKHTGLGIIECAQLTIA